MTDLKIFVTSDNEAKDVVVEHLSKSLNLAKDIISGAIEVSNSIKFTDGEDIFIVHKKTKSNKDKLVYVLFAH